MKLTIRRVIELAVQISKTPKFASEIVTRAADAANLEVVVVEADPLDAVRQLASLLEDKLGSVASDDCEAATDLIDTICQDLWRTVNNPALNSGDGQHDADEGSSETEDQQPDWE